MSTDHSNEVISNRNDLVCKIISENRMYTCHMKKSKTKKETKEL